MTVVLLSTASGTHGRPDEHIVYTLVRLVRAFPIQGLPQLVAEDIVAQRW